MLKSRRKFIKNILSISTYGLTIASGFLHSAWANILWQKESFSPRTYEGTLSHLFKDVEFIDSKKIKFKRLPRVAENGAVVPITITSTLENIDKISILVEKNPHPLIAEFYLSAAVEPIISARLKMAETSNVIAIIEAEGKYYRNSQKVVVAVGGCGG